MVKLKAALGIALGALAACGGGNDTKPTVDAPAPTVDAPAPTPDAPSGPDARVYDFSCMNNPQPTGGPSTITVSGNTPEIALTGPTAATDVTVEVFAAGGSSPAASTTSDSSAQWTTGVTPSTMPFDGFVKGSKTAYRSTFVVPPQKVNADLPGVSIKLVKTTTWAGVAGIAGATQDDANNGAFMLTITDCAGTAIPDATLNVKQGGTAVGQDYSLAQLSPTALGVHIVYNVPAGDANVTATYMGTTFPSQPLVVPSFKNQASGTGGAITTGALTLSTVRPGPL